MMFAVFVPETALIIFLYAANCDTLCLDQHNHIFHDMPFK